MIDVIIGIWRKSRFDIYETGLEINRFNRTGSSVFKSDYGRIAEYPLDIV